ncbi:MAG TPA: hypothetical protein VG755_44305 [Nannocystaceae bacterium]|nr:hypothetical protein [Nannocystaceae bacterium]
MLGAIFAGLLIFAAPSEQVGLPVVLAWSAPPECATQADVEDDIARLGGARPMGGADAQRVEIAVVAGPEGYALQLRRNAADGTLVETRELAGPDCRVLARAAALIIVVGIDPLGTAQQIERIASEPPAPAAVVASTPAIVRAPAPTLPRPPKWRHRFLAGAIGGLAVGHVPGVSGSIGGWIGYSYGPLRFELAGDHVFARTRIDADVGVIASSSGGGFTFVVAPRLGPVLGLFGTGVQLGALRGRGTGSRVMADDALDWWATIPIVIGLEWPPQSRIALRVQGELGIAARRPGLAVRDAAGDPRGGFRRPEATARVLVGPTLRLP